MYLLTLKQPHMQRNDTNFLSNPMSGFSKVYNPLFLHSMLQPDLFTPSLNILNSSEYNLTIEVFCPEKQT